MTPEPVINSSLEETPPTPTRGSSVLKGAAVVTLGQVVSYGCSFLRNLILARLLTKADFGLVAAFAMTITLLELASRMSFGVQIIQARSGAQEAFVATAHAFQFVMSMASAALMVIFAAPFAHAFDVPETAWAFAMLALVPFCGGFAHLDVVVRQRRMEFLPGVIAEALPQIAVTAAVWPLAVWLDDFRVILVVLIAKAALTTALTHVLAKRVYRWSFNREIGRSMFAFSWPLLFNGLVMFGAQQADQMIVGSFISLEELAVYAAAYSLISIPWFIFARVLSQLMLPVLSRNQEDPASFRINYQRCLEASTVGSLMILAPMVAVGEEVVTLLFSGKFSGAGTIAAVLGVTCGFRFLRLAPAVAATARADTRNQLYSNLWRSVSLPLAIIVALLGGNVIAIAGSAFVGELLACGFAIIRLRQRCDIPESDHLPSIIVLSVSLGSALAIALVVKHWTLPLAITAVTGLWIEGLIATKLLLPATTGTLWSMTLGAWTTWRARTRAA